jgi:D-3-phosphoglycerate dehydrogenase / 2-oxoglutarate reductase
VKVLITDRFDLNAEAHLKGHSKNLEVMRSKTPVPSSEELKGVQALIIRSRTKITKAFLETAPDLKFIVTSTSGFDHIDFEATKARGILTAYTPNANVQSAAELTWALVLACARRVPESGKAIRNGNWDREALNGIELAGKTYGVIGFGRIGKTVAKLAQAFGMRVLAYDPYIDDEEFTSRGVARFGCDEVLRMSDVVSLHVPATEETSPLLRSTYLSLLQSHAILVNTSRGSAIHERALIDVLQAGKLRAVGLDVFEKEPLDRHSELTRFNNVVLTPHLGATTTEAFAKSSLEAAEKVLKFFASGSISEPISDSLPPEAEWYVRTHAKRS